MRMIEINPHALELNRFETIRSLYCNDSISRNDFRVAQWIELL